MNRHIATCWGGLLFLFLLSSCSKNDSNDDPDPIMKNVAGLIETDQSRYNPGEIVNISLNLNRSDFDAIHILYRHLTKLIHEETLPVVDGQVNISWLPPTSDFMGYSIEFEFIKEGVVVDYASTAIDVSSDWTKFPRYGFLSKFTEMSDSEMDQVIKHLNSYHINGLQFYDWHNKHHMPLKMEGNAPATGWTDIARRSISFNTVEQYIQKAKSRQMASMSYNLLYGAWEDYATDGVSKEWFIYNDSYHNSINKHELDNNWAQSDILVLNPANTAWQDYIFGQTALIYQHLPFDGWHLDQLGHRGNVYDYTGKPIDLWLTYIPFLENLGTTFPEKKMLLNAVNQYGQKEILGTGVDFTYTEVWDPHDEYSDLAEIIMENSQFNLALNSVLAAYVNYDLADQSGEFNDAAVLMVDAVIMAFGGMHLELGEHMLGKEYFPNNNLSMSKDLQEDLMEYYDFLVAWQNLLRDGGNIDLSPGVASNTLELGAWPPEKDRIAAFSKEVDGKTVCHLLNFHGVNSLKWRDNSGSLSAPSTISNFSISIPADQVTQVSYASPDWHDGVQTKLDFVLNNGKCEVEIPSLRYWGMVIIE